ncbi:MAG: type II secretion system protein [Candidatus Omnitrophica bacterium]|nr:type II secretion system protein [Candidatus Omnitrophota bacterium]
MSLVELIIAMLLFSVLITAGAMSFHPILRAWPSQQDRMGMGRQVQHGMEGAIRQLRPATALQNDANGGIRLTVRENGNLNSYILYLYHPSDPWGLPFTQADGYQLRQAGLTGGINGSFTYGEGTLLMQYLKAPPDSNLSSSGSVATLDLTLSRGDDTLRLIERVKRRNF